MYKEIIYNELVRQFDDGNKADNIVNKKVDFLLVSSFVFIGYFFTADSFIDILIKGNILIKHIFGAGLLLLIISLFFTVKAFLLMRFKRGLKIDKIDKIIKKYPKIDEFSIINFSLKNAIKYNYEKQKKKNVYFLKGLISLAVSIMLFIISKIIIIY